MAGIRRTEHKYPAEVYRLYDAEGALLYVGVAADVVQRLRTHSYRPPTGKEWWPEVAYCALEWFPIYHKALVAEVAAIKAERPRHNRRSVPPRVYTGVGWPVSPALVR